MSITNDSLATDDNSTVDSLAKSHIEQFNNEFPFEYQSETRPTIYVLKGDKWVALKKYDDPYDGILPLTMLGSIGTALLCMYGNAQQVNTPDTVEEMFAGSRKLRCRVLCYYSFNDNSDSNSAVIGFQKSDDIETIIFEDGEGEGMFQEALEEARGQLL